MADDDLLLRRLEREREARKHAEKLLETKSRELFQANNDLANVADDLEAKIRERTEHLNKALSEARRAGRVKQQFITNVSHELKTPLNGIMGVLQLLNERPQDATQQRFIDEALLCADRLQVLISDMLDISRLESGAVQLDEVEFDLSELIKETVSHFKENARAKNIIIKLTGLLNNSVMIIADRLRLRQVLFNLIENAIKFTDSGSVTINLICKDIDTENLTLFINVSDTGCGISQDHIADIFNVFTQADETSSRRYQGAGLGLPTANELIGIMGGNLKVQSIENVGSTFSIKLPVQHTLKACPIENQHVIFLAPYDGDRAVTQKEILSIGLHVEVANDPSELVSKLNNDLENPIILVDERIANRDADMLLENLNEQQLSRALLVCLSKQVSLSMASKLNLSGLIEQPVSISELKSFLGLFLCQRIEPISESVVQVEKKQNSEHTTDDWADNFTHLEKWKAPLLLVEDNRVNALVVSELLKKHGVIFDWVMDGKQALDALQRNTYGMILMDCQMPVMDGYEATRKIRNGECGERVIDIPIIALTADNPENGLQDFLKKDMDGWLPKPLSQIQLERELHRHLLEPTYQINDNSRHSLSSNQLLMYALLETWQDDIEFISLQRKQDDIRLDLNDPTCPIYYMAEIVEALEESELSTQIRNAIGQHHTDVKLAYVFDNTLLTIQQLLRAKLFKIEGAL